MVGLFDEWAENPPPEIFLRAYFKYESPNDKPQAGDKFWGDDDLPAPPQGAPPISQAPPEVQAIFEHFVSTRKRDAA